MAKVEITALNNDVFGKLIKITNSIVDVMVTVDFGPRIIHCSLSGKDNMFYMDTQKSPLGEIQECYGGDILRLCGGHRVWISPEIMPRCYYPDSLPVDFKEIKNGAEFTAPVEKLNNIQKSITVTLNEDNSEINVVNKIKNCGVWNIEFAPWSITMLDKGGKEIIPMPDRDTGYLSNRSLVLWPYSKMNDKRVYWGDKFITLMQDEKAETPFKLGINNEYGWAAYFNKEQLFFKKFDSVADGNYPDNGCCYETYTNNVMCEMETLGEFVNLTPGDSVSLNEKWNLFECSMIPSDNESDIQNIIEKYKNK